MKKNSSKFLLLLLAIMFFATFYWLFIKNETRFDIESQYSEKPTAQQEEKRVWVKFRYQGAIEVDEVYTPVNIISGDEYFYVGDWSDSKVKKIDAEGNIVEVFGKGKGEGPGEFLQINSIDLDNSGRIWISDELTGRITIFDDIEDFEVVNVKIMPNKLVVLNDKYFVISDRFDTRLKISSLNSSENMFSEAIVSRDRELWSRVFDSTFMKADSSNLVRVFYYTTDIVKYNEEGEILFVRRPIEAFDIEDLKIIPPRQYEENQEQIFYEVSPSSNLPQMHGLHIDERYIYILTSEVQGELFIRDIIDVYDLQTGDYLHSFRTPEPIYYFSLMGNTILGIRQETGQLVIWKFIEEDEIERVR